LQEEILNQSQHAGFVQDYLIQITCKQIPRWNLFHRDDSALLWGNPHACTDYTRTGQKLLLGRKLLRLALAELLVPAWMC
jgi:hypothetical protein